MVKLLVRHPEVLGYSYEANIVPTIDALKHGLCVDDDELGELVLAAPSALGLSVEKTLRPRITVLRQRLSLKDDEMAALVRKYPRVILLSVEERMDTLSEMLALSAEELRSLVLRYPQSLSLSAEENVRPTCEALLALLGAADGGTADASDDDLVAQAEVRTLVLRLPSCLGLSVEANLSPKLAFLTAELGVSPATLRALLLREPAVLGASLERSLRPNVALWRAALPEGTCLGDVAAQRGLRWLTCNAEKRTRPRLQAAAAAGVPATALLSKSRLTDGAFADWLRGAARAHTSSAREPTRDGSIGQSPR